MYNPAMRHSLIPTLVFCAACGGPFAEARREGTSAAYASFVANHPTHPRAPKAAQRAEALDWEAAVTADNAAGYARYAITHPGGPHAEEARTLGELRSWSEAKGEGTLVALSAYVAEYPNGVHHQDALFAIEDIALDEARFNNSVESWGRYLFRYPEGRFTEEARTRRDEVAWEATTLANSREAYESYLAKHSQGEHRQEAREWLASLAFSTIQPVLILRSTWRPVNRQSSDRSRRARALDGLLGDLKSLFTVRPLIVEDGEPDGHPADRHGRELGVGLLVVELSEDVGALFEPSGHATRMPSTISVYAAPADAPLWSWTFEAGTPERIVGSFEESLYTEAVDDWGATLRGAPIPAETLKEPIIP